MKNNGLIIICGLIATFTLFFSLSYVGEPTVDPEFFVDVDNDDDDCNDSDLSHYQQFCCYEVDKIAEECSISHDPETCRVERWENSLCK